MNHDRFRNGSLARIEFVFLFIELDEINHRLLKEKLDEYQSSVPIWPTNIKLFVKPCRFEDVSKNGIEEYILNAPIGRNLRQATFLFVDPFGFTGFSMALLSQICQPRDGHTVELFINFMSYYILRSITEQSQGRNFTQEKHMTKLFGIDIEEWRTFRDKKLADKRREEDLLEFFTNQLQNHADFKHILSLKMKRQDQSPIYYLIHATRHIKGVESMKDAMWKWDPDAAEDLCSRSESLEALLLQYFQKKPAGEPFKIDDIEEFIITKTPFKKRCVEEIRG